MSGLVFKILKAGRSFHAIGYNDRKEAKGQARLIHWQGFGEWQDGRNRIGRREMAAYLQRHSARNARVTHPQFHAILSSRGDSVPVEIMRKRALDLMASLGYGQNPIVLYSHSDTEHRHLHIISSRVGPDGRKISDRFEGIRARKALNLLEGIDTGKVFRKDLEEAMGYRVGSLRQFQLLMETRGYRSRRREEELCFFRHGVQQGSVAIAGIEKHIREHPPQVEVAQRIRGLALAHRDTWDRSLALQGHTRKGASRVWSSAFSEQMHHRFGCQFVFFSAGRHEWPYGYVVIDHTQQTVLKGGDVLRLAQLIDPAPIRGRPWDESSEYPFRGNADAAETKGETRISSSESLAGAIGRLLSEVEQDVREDVRQAETTERKKKRRIRGR